MCLMPGMDDKGYWKERVNRFKMVQKDFKFYFEGRGGLNRRDEGILGDCREGRLEAETWVSCFFRLVAEFHFQRERRKTGR